MKVTDVFKATQNKNQLEAEKTTLGAKGKTSEEHCSPAGQPRNPKEPNPMSILGHSMMELV